MTDEIKKIANSKINELNDYLKQSDTCWKYKLGQMTEFHSCYYFDHLLDFTFCEKKETLAGAPGFIIDKITLEASTVTFGELGELKKLDEEKKEIIKIIKKVKSQTVQLSKLKGIFDIDSPELLKLSKSIKNEQITIELVNYLHSKIKKDIALDIINNE